MSDRLLSWFEKRRKSKTLELAQLQMMKAIDTVSELERALGSYCEGSIGETESRIKRLFQEEIEIDELRRAVFEELTKGELPTKYREDLKSLVEKLDRMADHVKDSARNIKILVESETTIPKDISYRSHQIATKLVECTQYLNKSIVILGVDPAQSIDLAKKVDACEGEIDDAHLNIKIMLIKTAGSVNAPTLLVVRDLVEAMERAADMCADTADFVRTLAIAEA